MSAESPQVVIIGAGPAGLTAAYELTRHGIAPIVLESDDVVGGISRTVVRDGWRFDIGGHRFFTKVERVSAFWHEILEDDDFLLRPRMSRIYYGGKYYDYPLKAFNALRNLGMIEAIRCMASYGWVRVRPPKDTSNFEGWVASRFGWRLYRTFFKTYTEKVWGVDAAEIQSDFAAQRIKNLSLWKAVWNSVLPKRNQTDITSLIEEFEYPKYGPGMMWEVCRDKIESRGATVIMNTAVTEILHADGHVTGVKAVGPDGTETLYPCTDVISSMPFAALARGIRPEPPEAVLEAADDLRFRDFLSVALVIPEADGFPDNWIYIHEPDVELGRIQNYGSWSPFMVKDGRTCLGLEYFVDEGDWMWEMADDELIELGKKELQQLHLVDPAVVEEGYVVRMKKAYPMYDEAYQGNVETIRKWLEADLAGAHPIGRNGMHRYNNQDHSMYTAMLTVENILGADHDIWAVNVEDEYHEEVATAVQQKGTGRDAPVLDRKAVERAKQRRAAP